MGVDDNAHTVAWSERQHDKGFRRLAGRATVAQKQSAVERWARARPDNRAQRGWLLAALRSGAAQRRGPRAEGCGPISTSRPPAASLAQLGWLEAAAALHV